MQNRLLQYCHIISIKAGTQIAARSGEFGADTTLRAKLIWARTNNVTILLLLISNKVLGTLSAF